MSLLSTLLTCSFNNLKFLHIQKENLHILFKLFSDVTVYEIHDKSFLTVFYKSFLGLSRKLSERTIYSWIRSKSRSKDLSKCYQIVVKKIPMHYVKQKLAYRTKN